MPEQTMRYQWADGSIHDTPNPDDPGQMYTAYSQGWIPLPPPPEEHADPYEPAPTTGGGGYATEGFPEGGGYSPAEVTANMNAWQQALIDQQNAEQRRLYEQRYRDWVINDMRYKSLGVPNPEPTPPVFHPQTYTPQSEDYWFGIHTAEEQPAPHQYVTSAPSTPASTARTTPTPPLPGTTPAAPGSTQPAAPPTLPGGTPTPRTGTTPTLGTPTGGPTPRIPRASTTVGHTAYLQGVTDRRVGGGQSLTAQSGAGGPGSRQMTADEWNWYIQQQTGQTQPAPEDFGFSGAARNAQMSWEVYQQQRGAAGFPVEWSGPSLDEPSTEPPYQWDFDIQRRYFTPPPVPRTNDVISHHNLKPDVPDDGGPGGNDPYNPSGPGGPPSGIPQEPTGPQPQPYTPEIPGGPGGTVPQQPGIPGYPILSGSDDIARLPLEDRAYLAARGERIDQALEGYLADERYRAAVFSGALEGAYGTNARAFAEGGGGYTPEEAAAIQRTAELEALKPTVDDELRNFYTPEEQLGIVGDPGQIRGYFRPDYLDAQVLDAAQNARGVLYGPSGFATSMRTEAQDVGNRLRNAVNANRMALSYEAGYGAEQALTAGERNVRQTIDPNYLTQDPNTRARIETELARTDAERKAAIDYNKLRYSDEARQNVASDLASTSAAIRDTIDRGRMTQDPNAHAGIMGELASGEARGRGAIDYGKLGLSGEYLQDFRFGKEDERRIVELAAASEGKATQATLDRIRRGAAAAGNVSPLALAAAENRARLTGALGEGSARREAEVAAKQLALQTAQQREQTRLGAEQTYADMAYGAERDIAERNVATRQQLEAQRIAAEQGYAQTAAAAEEAIAQRQIGAHQWQEEQRLGAEKSYAQLAAEAAQAGGAQRLAGQQWLEENRLQAEQEYSKIASQAEQELAQRRLATGLDLERMRMAGEKDIAAAQLQAETEAGRQRMDAEGRLFQGAMDTEARIGQQQQEMARYITSQGLEMEKYIEAQQAQRRAEIAKNRQETERYNQQQRYTRGMEIGQTASERAKQVAGGRVAAEQEYRNYLAGQQGRAYENVNTGRGQQIGAYGVQGPVQNQATHTAANYDLGRRGLPTLGSQIAGAVTAGVGALSNYLNNRNQLPSFGGGGLTSPRTPPTFSW